MYLKLDHYHDIFNRIPDFIGKLKKEVINEITNSFNMLCQFTPEHLKKELKSRLQTKSFIFKKYAESEKINKLSKLRQKLSESENTKNKSKTSRNKVKRQEIK